MAIYGSSIYHRSNYGADRYGGALGFTPGQAVSAGLSVDPMVASPFSSSTAGGKEALDNFGYGVVSLTWAQPTSTYTTLRLVRNSAGYPVSALDGVVVGEWPQNAQPSYFVDSNLAPGQFFYYSIFLSITIPTWDATKSYNVNDLVKDDDTGTNYYQAIVASTNVDPEDDTTHATWLPSNQSDYWVPAGAAECLTISAFGNINEMWSKIPSPYKTSILDEDPGSGQALFDFIRAFGYHFDVFKTDVTTLFSLNNPYTAKWEGLVALASELGFDPVLIGYPVNTRNAVENAATLYKQRGQALGIENLIRIVTGWNVTVSEGSNLLPNNDVAAFSHPNYLPWSPATLYTTGALVTFSAKIYASIAGSLGQATSPTGTTSANSYWTYVSPSDVTVANPIVDPMVNPLTAAAVTWQMQSLTGGYLPTQARYGFSRATNGPSAIYGTDSTQNCGWVTGVTSGGADITVRSFSDIPAWVATNNYWNGALVQYNSFIYRATHSPANANFVASTSPDADTAHWQYLYPANSGVEREQLAKEATPLIRYPRWEQTTQYHVGDIVKVGYYLYQAFAASVGSAPTGSRDGNASWMFLRMANDVYVGSIYGKSASTGRTASAYLEWYDQNGKLITTGQLPSAYSPASFLDRFDGGSSSLAANIDNNLRLPWTVLSGTWNVEGGVVTPTVISGAVQLAYQDAGHSDVTVGVTFHYPVTGGVLQGLVFRLSDASNYWVATQTQLYKVVAGTRTAVGAAYTALVPGDRIYVTLVGSVITVMKYAGYGIADATLVAAVTDSFNSTATKHGLFVGS